MSEQFSAATRAIGMCAELRGYALASVEYHRDDDGNHRTATARMETGEESTGSPAELMRWINTLPDRFDFGGGNFRKTLRKYSAR